MNAEQLLRHYQRIADAPDAVARLRAFVRDLAVRGKLVAQDEREVAAPAELRRKTACDAKASEFHLPSSWLWVPVGLVAISRLGKMLDKSKNRGTQRPYLRNINVRWFGFALGDLLEMPFEDHELAEFALRTGDVLICEGGEPGRAGVWRGEANGVFFQKAIHRVRFAESVDPDFFVQALRASRLLNLGLGWERSLGRGSERVGFSSGCSCRRPFPALLPHAAASSLGNRIRL